MSEASKLIRKVVGEVPLNEVEQPVQIEEPQAEDVEEVQEFEDQVEDLPEPVDQE